MIPICIHKIFSSLPINYYWSFQFFFRNYTNTTMLVHSFRLLLFFFLLLTIRIAYPLNPVPYFYSFLLLFLSEDIHMKFLSHFLKFHLTQILRYVQYNYIYISISLFFSCHLFLQHLKRSIYQIFVQKDLHIYLLTRIHMMFFFHLLIHVYKHKQLNFRHHNHISTSILFAHLDFCHWSFLLQLIFQISIRVNYIHLTFIR